MDTTVTKRELGMVMFLGGIFTLATFGAGGLSITVGVFLMGMDIIDE